MSTTKAREPSLLLSFEPLEKGFHSFIRLSPTFRNTSEYTDSKEGLSSLSSGMKNS